MILYATHLTEILSIVQSIFLFIAFSVIVYLFSSTFVGDHVSHAYVIVYGGIEKTVVLGLRFLVLGDALLFVPCLVCLICFTDQ